MVTMGKPSALAGSSPCSAKISGAWLILTRFDPDKSGQLASGVSMR
jgi:hypothetical protein